MTLMLRLNFNSVLRLFKLIPSDFCWTADYKISTIKVHGINFVHSSRIYTPESPAFSLNTAGLAALMYLII